MVQKKTEPGLDYMISLGFRPAKSLSGVEDQIARVSNRDLARKIRLEIERRADGDMDNTGFYSFKNSNYRVSLALTSAFDADILRKACNWITSHAEYFGDTILEVGCDCGVMSCFLAKTFPNAKIVAIDRCAEAIENAKLFAEEQGVDNVAFRVCDLKEINESFDSVFSMRTVHENLDMSEEEDLTSDLSETALLYKDSLLEYAANLSRVLKDNGQLISFERIGRDGLLLGWMEALDAAGLAFDVSCYDEMTCQEIGVESVFRTFICFKGVEHEINAKDLFDFACSKYLDYSLAHYEGWDAKIVFENRRGKLIEGYYLEFPSQHVKARASLWTHSTDETCLVMYQNVNGNVSVSFLDISQKEELLASMREENENCRKQGNVIIKKMID